MGVSFGGSYFFVRKNTYKIGGINNTLNRQTVKINTLVE